MKKLIVANWKMNPLSLKEAKFLLNSVKKNIKKNIKKIRNTDIVICPPFVYFSALKPNGAQNVFYEEKGAFTGEISPLMLKNFGIKYVIIGHSERRKYQKETKETIKNKIKKALSAGLKPILCIDKVSQIPEDIKKGIIIAYEPLFSIGTGKPCLPEKAKKIRMLIKNKIKVPVLYGGSVNSQNARDYIEKSGFQGLLIGGASLNAQEFGKIVQNIEMVHE